MARLYADEDFPLPVINLLKGWKHDIVRPASSLDDREVLNDAINRKRIVLTLNSKHFKKLHEEMRWHYGIIIGVHEVDFAVQAKAIDEFLAKNSDMRGKCEKVKGGRRRK